MQYALLINVNPAGLNGLTAEQQEEISGEYYAIAEDPRCIAGEHLQGIETATTVRADPATGVPLVTDGPFADTKEFFGGYYVFSADNLDEVLDVASKIPAARMGGAVEVRPIMERHS